MLLDVFLTDREKALKKEVRDFVKEVPPELTKQLDRDEIHYPRQYVKNLGDRNLIDSVLGSDFQRNIDNETQNQNTLIVRGGRPNEVAYYVDGFSQQDPLTGTSSTSRVRSIARLSFGVCFPFAVALSGCDLRISVKMKRSHAATKGSGVLASPNP